MNLSGDGLISGQYGARPRPWATAAALSLIVLAALGLRLLAFIGSQGTDDLRAAESACQLVTNPSGYLERFGRAGGTAVRLRQGLVLPVAVGYTIFGVSYASSYIFPLLTGLGNVVLAWVIGRLVLSRAAGWIAAALVAVSPLEVIHSTILFPDVPLAFYQGLAALLLILALRTNSVPRQVVLLLACGLTAWCAWMTKEVGLEMMVFLGLATLAEFLAGRRFWRGSLILVGFMAGLVAEGLFYWAATGDPVFRLTLRALSQNEVFLLARETDALGYLGRLLTWFDRIFEWRGPMDWAVVPAAALALYHLVKGDRWNRILSLWFLSGLAFFLISIALAYSYQPRRLLVLTMPASLLVAGFVVRFFLRHRRSVLLLALTGIYLCGALAAIGKQYRLQRSAHDNERRAHQFIADHPGDHVFYTDYRTKRVLLFYDGFADDARIALIPFAHRTGSDGGDSSNDGLGSLRWRFTREYPPERGSYVLLNYRYIDWLSERRMHVFPDYVTLPPLNWELIEAFREGRRYAGLDVFRVHEADARLWSEYLGARTLNLSFRCSSEGALPDGWTLVQTGTADAEVSGSAVHDPQSGQNVVCLRPSSKGSCYFFSGPGAFTHPPGTVNDPHCPILEANRFYRLDLTAESLEEQKLAVFVFVYDDQGARSTFALGHIRSRPAPVRRAFFFRGARQPVRYRIGIRLIGPGILRILDIKLYVQHGLSSTHPESTSAGGVGGTATTARSQTISRGQPRASDTAPLHYCG
jgi:hypothetical protein